jgi:hypothetical protein
VAIPIPSVQATYYEVFSLAALDHTLRLLTGSLLVGAVATVLLGVSFGRWVSGQALRPLSDAGGLHGRSAGAAWTPAWIPSTTPTCAC